MAVSSTEADLVVASGKIRTPAHPSGFVQALAVRDGMIQAVGTDDEMKELTGRRTRVIDLRGRLALPAFGDAHVHPVSGGLESLRCNLAGLRSRQECLDTVATYCSSLAPGAWVLGGGWTMSAFPGGLPTAADLDQVTGGRPAFLPNRDHHSACVGAAGELGMPDSFGAYRMAADYGMLSSHVVGALWWDRDRGLAQIDDMLARREAAGDGAFRATTVKLMLDGVCETFTAAMSSPYLDRSGVPTGHSGRLFIEPEMLAAAAQRLGAEGFQLHFHAIGDLAVSTALDALAALPAGPREAARHHLAHLQFITPRDMGRFAELGAVANFQPLWACAEIQMEELTLPFVGPERAVWQYQIGSLLQLGTRIAFGSDWPVSSADPLQEIHVAVNRVLSERLGRPGQPECENPFLPERAITVGAAVDAFTAGVAWVNHAEDVAGRLLPGMRADLTVLDQDLFAIPPRDIGSTSVVMTVADGTVVYGDR